jgi:hypothetical protein
MLLLPTKQTDKIDLFFPLLKNIKETSGGQFGEQVKPILQRLQTLRNDLTDIYTIRNNPTAVQKAVEKIKDYLSIWNSIAKSFTFGSGKESVNICFTWYDAYTKEKKTGINPIAERIGMLYNLGVMYSQMGADMGKLPGDKVKQAASLFLTAAWIFERIKRDLVSLKLTEYTPDVSENNLTMCSFLMKAQAQSCAYERVRANRPDKYDLLAKLAMQASKDYEVANGYSKAIGLEKTIDGKILLGIMQFKEGALRSYAYYWSAMDQKKKCEESVIGMGKALASINKAMNCLEELKKQEKNFPPEVMNEYKTLHTHCAELQRTIENLNNKLYHESVPSRAAEIDAMPYGKPISIEGELDRPFEGKEIILLTVPAGVKVLSNEYRKEVGNIIQESFDMIRQVEDNQVQMLKKYNLPSSIHVISNEQKIPDDMWQRIKKCKENGGGRGLKHLMEGVEDLAKCNENSLKIIYNQLKEEENEDKELKEKYGLKWTRLPSLSLNVNMLKQLENFKQKYEAERQLEKATKESAQASKFAFDLLELDRESITNKIPKSSKDGTELPASALK